jgi:hypothetical protein
MELTRSFDSQADPGVRIRVRRISLRERLQFTEESFEWIQQLQFLAAQPDLNGQTIARMNRLEANISKLVLRHVWLALESAAGVRQANEELIEWLMNEAPADFCCEVVAHCSDQIALSGAQRKK